MSNLVYAFVPRRKFSDVEDDLRQYLNASPLVVPTSFVKRPPTLPDVFIFLQRTGGVRRLVTDHPRMSLECYARSKGSPDEGMAIELANVLREVMQALHGGKLAGRQVYDVEELSGPYSDPDPLTPNHARFTALYQMSVRCNTTI